MKSKDVEQLLLVASARLESVQSRLAGLTRSEDAIRSQLAELEACRLTCSYPQSSSMSPAIEAQTNLRWLRWIDNRRSKLNTELAQLRAKRLRQIEIVRTAFGRKEALAGLHAKLATDQRIQLRRRSSGILTNDI